MTTLIPFALQCAMCYQNAAQQGAKGVAAMNAGILVLLIPPLAIIGCITWMAYRRANDSDSSSEPPA